MKKLILTFGIVIAGLCSVYAQTKGDKATAKLVDKLTQICQLSPEQVTKVQPIVADFVNGRISNKQQYGNDPVALKSANKANRENYKAQLKTVLSPEQMHTLKAYEEQHKGNRQGEQEEKQQDDGQEDGNGQK